MDTSVLAGWLENDVGCRPLGYHIGSDYGALTTTRGTSRRGPHPGVDTVRDIVIAPADGEVRVINFNSWYGYQVPLQREPRDLGANDADSGA